MTTRAVALSDAGDAYGIGRARLGSAGIGGLTRAARGAVPPPALVLLGIISVQLGAGLAKHLFAALPPTGVVTLRIVTAAAALCVIARPSLRGVARADLGVAIAFGLTMAMMNFSFYQAVSRIPLGIAVTIEFLGPLGVAIAGSRRKLDGLWALLAAGGVVALSGGGEGLNLVGAGFALLAACCWAGYILLSASAGRRFPGSSGLTIAMVVSSIAILPVGVTATGAELLDPRFLLLGAAVGLLATVIPYTLEMEALRRIPPKVFGVLLSLEPAVGALVGLVVLGEMLGVTQWIAIACVVAASAGATRTSQPPSGESA